MKYLLYSHARALSLAEVTYAWLYRGIRRLALGEWGRRMFGRRGRRILLAAAVVVTLVIESVLIYMLAELVHLCISLMELWTELARKHLEITL